MQIQLNIGEVQEGGMKSMSMAEGSSQSSTQEQRVIDAMKFLFKIPTVPNPDFISEAETPDVPRMVNEFSDADWVQESTRRWIISQVARYEQRMAMDAIQIQPDNTLIN